MAPLNHATWQVELYDVLFVGAEANYELFFLEICSGVQLPDLGDEMLHIGN